MIQQQEHSGFSDRRPEPTTGGVFKVPAEGHRESSSRNIRVPATGDQNLQYSRWSLQGSSRRTQREQQQEHSGSSDRRPKPTTAGVFKVPAEGD